MTPWIENMKRTRTDLWVRAFDGAYRLHLPFKLVSELESACGRGVPSIAAGIPDDRGETAQPAITHAQGLNVVRLALIGGATAVVDGKRVAVTPATVTRLVAEHLADAPVAETWRLARAILAAAEDGRPATAAEVAVFTVENSNAPVVPAWAELDAAA